MAYRVTMDRGCGHTEEVGLATGWHRREQEKKAFYASPCPVCGYVKGRGGAASAPGPAPIETAEGTNSPRHYGTNKRTGRCRICGGLVAPGKGWLYHIDPDESYEHAGWVVEHKDHAACEHYAAIKTIYH
jgi:hypothetical protein